MPKERRKRSGAHEPSVKLNKRQFAAQDNAVEHIEIGAEFDSAAADLLQGPELDAESSSMPALNKKEKRDLKREALLERLMASQSPYSKSHAKRLKRKAKEQVGGGMDEIQHALAAVDDEAVVDAPGATTDAKPKKPKLKQGQIGEGKSATLSKAQRAKALKTEKLRQPLILKTSEFASNPFATIRTHAQNTLVRHDHVISN